MEDKIKAIEEQVERLRCKKKKHSNEEHRSKKKVLKQKLTMELINNIIDDLEHRKEELLRMRKTPPEG